MVKNKNIIDGRQKGYKKVIECILTAIAWLYMLVYIISITYGLVSIAFDIKWRLPAIYTIGMVQEVGTLFKISGIILLITIVVMLLWKQYNYKKFGKLNRRRFKESVKNDEIAELFGLEIYEVEELQDKKFIELEENITNQEN